MQHPGRVKLFGVPFLPTPLTGGLLQSEFKQHIFLVGINHRLGLD